MALWCLNFNAVIIETAQTIVNNVSNFIDFIFFLSIFIVFRFFFV